MSRPLELIIYPKSVGRHGETVYTGALFEWTYRESDCDRYAEMKRLTDAELAAEYYRASFLHENSVAQDCGYDDGPETREHRRQALTIRRFATLPGYDEPMP